MPMARLNPQFTIADKPYIMATQLMAAVPLTEIGELIADLSLRGDQITAATDFLFRAFDFSFLPHTPRSSLHTRPSPAALHSCAWPAWWPMAAFRSSRSP